MRKIVDVLWFCGATNVGIVMVEDFGERKYYIGAIQGNDRETDKQFIADYGTRLPKAAGDVLFGHQ